MFGVKMIPNYINYGSQNQIYNLQSTRKVINKYAYIWQRQKLVLFTVHQTQPNFLELKGKYFTLYVPSTA